MNKLPHFDSPFNLGGIAYDPFNPSAILQEMAGVEVSEDDQESCGCKDCTSEEDDAEDIAGSIVKAFMLMGAIKALEEKKEGK